MTKLFTAQKTALAFIAKDRLFDRWLSWSELSFHLSTAYRTAMNLVRLGFFELNDDNRRFRLTEKGREYIIAENPHFDSFGELAV